MKVSIIVAVSKNNVIGANGTLPWKMPADMAFFKQTTMGHCVIMGRKTFESLKRPLVGRYNIVLSRRSSIEMDNCHRATTLSEALEIARSRGENEVFVIGGASIYQQALAGADRIYLTRIEAEVSGDTCFRVPHFQSAEFPQASETQKEIDQNVDKYHRENGSSDGEWTVHSEEVHPADDRNPFPYRFIRLDRVPI